MGGGGPAKKHDNFELHSGKKTNSYRDLQKIYKDPNGNELHNRHLG